MSLVQNLLLKISIIWPLFEQQYPDEALRGLIGDEYIKQWQKHKLTPNQVKEGIKNLSDLDHMPKPAEFARFCKPHREPCHKLFEKALPAPPVDKDKAEAQLKAMKDKLKG